ncbi:MAG: metal-dependent transcriptional regulator [Chloroflexi bacterium]|nr:metal-dependent transcriptional regulator [Chloroflexota bacterium]
MPRTPRPAKRPVEEPLSDTIERYLEAIFYIDAEGDVVRAARLAEWLDVSQPSTASALQRMTKSGLVESNVAKDVLLTHRGRELASEIVRRHRIAERWLVDVLKFDWLTADQEASRLEHGMSREVADRLFELIGRPNSCPHGNPIPGAGGKRPPERALSTLSTGDCAPLLRISEVAEHEVPDLLSFLGEHGFALGREIQVLEVSRGAGTVTVRVNGSAVAMSMEVAGKVWVGV